MESSQIDERSSRTEQEHEYDERESDVARLVPVTESIRYRRRAQSAEKSAQEMAEKLTTACEQLAQMTDDLEALRLDRRLTDKLLAAGVTDLESAMLLARSRMEGPDAPDIEALVASLKAEKRHLFGRVSESVTSRKTSGVRDRTVPGRAALAQAAAKAARTQKQTDLQEYLRLRRNAL
jgi:hypothetical protein